VTPNGRYGKTCKWERYGNETARKTGTKRENSYDFGKKSREKTGFQALTRLPSKQGVGGSSPSGIANKLIRTKHKATIVGDGLPQREAAGFDALAPGRCIGGIGARTGKENAG
jgi:hypothetical protein